MNNRFKAFLVALCGFCLLLTAAAPKPDPNSREVQAWSLLSAGLDSMQQQVSVLKTAISAGDIAVVNAAFGRCRGTYKRIEALVEYYYPASALRINGAALPEAEPSEPEEPLQRHRLRTSELDMDSPVAGPLAGLAEGLVTMSAAKLA